MENKRLTYKLNEQEQEEHKTKYLKFKYFPIPDYCIEKGNYGRITSDMIYNKLGKLEDLQEQLGCPLEIVITPYFKRGKLEVFYRGKMREVIRVVAFEQATRPYMDVFYRDNEKEQFKVKTIWLDDYKKTWWLKEDKSE